MSESEFKKPELNELLECPKLKKTFRHKKLQILTFLLYIANNNEMEN